MSDVMSMGGNSVETLDMRGHEQPSSMNYRKCLCPLMFLVQFWCRDVTGERRHIMNSSKLFLISSSAELTLLKLGPFLTMSDILMDIINAGVNISSGNPASAAIGYAMLFTCFLYPGKMHSNAKFLFT